MLCTVNDRVIAENICKTVEDKLKLYIYVMKDHNSILEHRVLFNRFKKVLVIFTKEYCESEEMRYFEYITDAMNEGEFIIIPYCKLLFDLPLSSL